MTEQTSENDDHATDVVRGSGDFRRAGYKAGWRAWCRICGEFGPENATPGDARVIAERHEEIGGFERHS